MRLPYLLAATLTALVVLAGCDDPGDQIARVVDPEMAELAKVQAMDRPAAAAHVPQCRIREEGCARVHEITGDACLRMAQDRLASVGAAPYAACAAARFGVLRNAGVPGTSLRGLEAERLVRETASRAEANEANMRLAALAAGVDHPAAGYYRASAVDWQATFASPVPCAALQEAQGHAQQAAAAGPAEGLDNRAAATTLANRLSQRNQAGGCT
ncbi:hypothetical protein E3U26_14310 (plasmid) [Paracoccus ferrooxidans]|nr:hypothetical protein E3U26_14310 [Paracoccus ferrooxidans]